MVEVGVIFFLVILIVCMFFGWSWIRPVNEVVFRRGFYFLSFEAARCALYGLAFKEVMMGI